MHGGLDEEEEEAEAQGREEVDGEEVEEAPQVATRTSRARGGPQGPPRAVSCAPPAERGALSLPAMRATLPGVIAALSVAAVLSPALSADDANDAMMAGRTGPGRVVHDPAYFRERVLPILDRQCVECHDAADAKNE